MNRLRKSILILLPAALAVYAGCTSKSPSEPRVDPVPPVPPPTSVTFNVTVTANPGQLAIGSGQSSTITVRVVRADNGQPPANLTPITLSTTLGAFGSSTGTSTTTLQLTNGTAQAVLFPGTDSGVATVRATLDASEGFANVQIGQGATFFIAFVEPSIGDPQGGDTATIHGGGFETPIRVTVGNANVAVLSSTADTIRIRTPSATQAGVTVPVGQAVPVSVGVTINVNEVTQKTDTLSAGFTYASGGGGGVQPQVFSISPTSGTNDGGTTMTINGSGFQSPVQVFFEGGSPTISVEAAVSSVTANRIVCLTPAARGFGQGLQNQTVDVRVKNVNSGFETRATGGFRYGSNVLITAVGPTEVVYNVPEQVVIQGQGFDEPLTVTLAGFAAPVQNVTGSRITVQSPIVSISNCAIPSGPIGVVNIDTGDGDDTTGQITFRFRPIVPVITSIVPGNGPAAGGTNVTITSAVSKFNGFDPPVRVVFGTQPAAVLSATPSTVHVSSPAFNGTFPTRACTVGTQTGTQMLPAPVNVAVTNLATGCTDTIANGFAYNPPDGSCVIAPPAPPVASFTFTKSGLQVNFINTSTGGPFSSILWNFGDTMTSSQSNPVHTYALPGLYTVTLTVTNGGGSSTAAQSLTVP